MTPGGAKPNATTPALARRSTSYGHDRARIRRRLRRLERQVRDVQRLVAEDAACLEVLTRLSVVIAATRQTGLLVLEGHLRGHIPGPERRGDAEREEILEELIGAIGHFVRSVG